MGRSKGPERMTLSVYKEDVLTMRTLAKRAFLKDNPHFEGSIITDAHLFHRMLLWFIKR